MKVLKEYPLYLNNFNLVGSNTIYLNKDFEIEQVFKGYQSIESNTLTTKDTIYKIASISKVIVAIGLLIVQYYQTQLLPINPHIKFSKIFLFCRLVGVCKV